MRQRELVLPFLALKLPLIIMSEGVEMGLGHDNPTENGERPKNAGVPDPAQTTLLREALKVETASCPGLQGPASKFSTPTGRVKAGWGPSPSLNSCL